MNTKDFQEFLKSLTSGITYVIDKTIPFSDYVVLDLSKKNQELESVNLSDPYEMQSYIIDLLSRKKGKLAFGGYNEQRVLYKDNAQFNGAVKRDIHLGIDLWIAAGTKVLAPLSGIVESFANNKMIGDYGPTIVLRHEYDEVVFFTLYGHLSTSSLDNLYIGKQFDAGDVIATLGKPEENVNYAPHLHFQIIRNLEGNIGDYPGVCSSEDRLFYLNNCPDPNLLLKLD